MNTIDAMLKNWSEIFSPDRSSEDQTLSCKGRKEENHKEVSHKYNIQILSTLETKETGVKNTSFFRGEDGKITSACHLNLLIHYISLSKVYAFEQRASKLRSRKAKR